MAEILAGMGIHKAFEELDIKATMTYRGGNKPHYEVWKLSKDDLKKLEYTVWWKDEWGWYRYSKGANRGTPYEPLTINGQFVIGWTAINNKDNFDCLTDYFKDGLGITDDYEVCACATTMAKTNGWSLSQTWRRLEG